MNALTVSLDVRDEIRSGQDPFTRIMAAVEALEPEQKLQVIAPFKPVPLLAVMARKGFAHQAAPLENSEDWQVVFERNDQPLPVPPVSSRDRDACTAPPVVEVDARGLEPPQPMIQILEAVEALPRGAELKARTDRQPMHLYAHLQERGFVGQSEPQSDGSYLTLIRHA